MSQNDPTLSRTNLEMVAVAGEYCQLIESHNSIDIQTFIKTLRSFVPLLYLRGSLLQRREPEYPEANERFVTEEQWDGIFTGLRETLAGQDEFQYFGFSEFGEQTVLNGSLSEHLADVYQDMKDFVLLFKKASLASRENAVYECYRLFSDHWGSRLAVILPVIHQLAEGNQGSQPTDDFQDIF